MLKLKVHNNIQRTPASRQCKFYARPVLAAIPRVACRASQQPDNTHPSGSSSPQDDLPPELRDLAISEDGFLIDTKTGKMINEMGATRFDVAVRALRGELDPPDWVENSERTPGVILSALYQFPRPYIFQVVGRVQQPAAAPAAAAAATTSGAAAPASRAAPTTASSSSSSSSAAAAAPTSAGRSCSQGSGPETRSTGISGVDGGGGRGGSGGASSGDGKEAFVADVIARISRVAQAEVATDKVEVKERLGGKYISVSVEVTVRAPELVAMVYDELAKDPRVIMKF
ncbi:hypothetical protein Agub_g5198 [Astrephomene gubernaculifera]|uniref:Uncharacterized protein n=1 Tax=Astrephomene gubernaculifera TaxID=47775 RepID=A0AAD3DLX1_9CHLO|nr:hypothetical protein Agub_g5198 [Astrephomene gubernaculifera]